MLCVIWKCCYFFPINPWPPSPICRTWFLSWQMLQDNISLKKITYLLQLQTNYSMKRRKMTLYVASNHLFRKSKDFPPWHRLRAPWGQEIMRRPAWKIKLSKSSVAPQTSRSLNKLRRKLDSPCVRTNTDDSSTRRRAGSPPPQSLHVLEALFIEYLRDEGATCLQPAWAGDKSAMRVRRTRETSQPACVLVSQRST